MSPNPPGAPAPPGARSPGGRSPGGWSPEGRWPAGTVHRNLLELPVVAAMAVVIVVGLRAFLVQPFYIPSVSMVPALEVHDKILVSRLSYRLHPIHRGDLVVFSEPPAVARADGSDSDDKGLAGLWHSVGERLGLVPRSDELVKRVIGLPGDLVEGRADGRIYVNNHLLMEPYLPPVVLGRPTLRPFAPVRVPKGMLWVLGDNREDSNDSTYFGPIPERTVVGRVVMRVWPIDHISFL